MWLYFYIIKRGRSTVTLVDFEMNLQQGRRPQWHKDTGIYVELLHTSAKQRPQIATVRMVLYIGIHSWVHWRGTSFSTGI